MSDLELCGTDELIEELRRRTDAGALIYAFRGKEGEEGYFRSANWGSNIWCLGAVKLLSGQLLRGLDDESVSVEGEDGESGDS